MNFVQWLPCTCAVNASNIQLIRFTLYNSAKAAGVVVMNEIGVDPGVDHLYALKTINEVHAEGGKVLDNIIY